MRLGDSMKTLLPKSHNDKAVSPSLPLIGALTAGVYLLTFLFYIRGPEVHSRTGRELFAWFAALSLLYLFWKGYQHVRQPAAALKPQTIIGFAALFCLIAALTYPFHSTDVFGYINRGWQQVHYNQNPYVYTLAEVPGWQQDPMLRFHWIYNPNPYGFLFTLIARFISHLGNGNWWLTLLLFKALNALAFGFTGWLIWRGAKLLRHDRPIVALYLFLWNPLILMHHLANGHNDILVGCLLALSIYLVIRGLHLWVIPVLVAATLLKYAPALFIPPALVYIIKRKGWKVAALGCLIGALVLLLVSAPYLQDWRQFRLADIQGNATLIDNSLHSFLIHIYRNIARLLPPLAQYIPTVDALIKPTLRGGFMVFLAIQLVGIPKDFPPSLLLEKSLLLLFVLICVVSSKFNGWYMGMLLAPALFLSAGHWLRRLIVLITCAQLLSITFFKQAYMLNYFAMILIPAWIVFRQARRERALAIPASEDLPAAPISTAAPQT